MKTVLQELIQWAIENTFNVEAQDGNKLTVIDSEELILKLNQLVLDCPCDCRYLITTKDVKTPFLTKCFEPKNHFNIDLEMIVYDLVECKFTTDGATWHDIEIDHL